VDEDLGSVISSSEDEALLGSYSPAPDDNEPEPPKEPPPPPPPDDDRMSLSPLSSGDEKIEEVRLFIHIKCSIHCIYMLILFINIFLIGNSTN